MSFLFGLPARWFETTSNMPTCLGYQVALDTQAHSMQAMHQLLSAETEALDEEDGQLLTKIEAQKTSTKTTRNG